AIEMVISSSPARSNDQSLKAARRSTTSRGLPESLGMSMSDMRSPRFELRKKRTRLHAHSTPRITCPCEYTPEESGSKKSARTLSVQKIRPPGAISSGLPSTAENATFRLSGRRNELELSGEPATRVLGHCCSRQSNRLDTDSSVAVRPIASPIRVAIDST